jgi:hypothetical protein
MEQTRQPGNPLVLSYLQLRAIVGVIGLALPFVLWIGGHHAGTWLPNPSLSSYYYTSVRNQFVASLCVIGAFLGACKGYDLRDEIAGYIAGLSAIGVAFFPTSYGCDTNNLVGTLHYACAAILFTTLAYFCIFQFTQSSDPAGMTPRKLTRNAVYRVCGGIMVACILAMLAQEIPAVSAWLGPCSGLTFYLESTAVLSFGIAWVTKGEAILKDKPQEAAEPAAPQA